MINIVNGAKYNAKLWSQRALKLNEDKNKSRRQERLPGNVLCLMFFGFDRKPRKSLCVSVCVSVCDICELSTLFLKDSEAKPLNL